MVARVSRTPLTSFFDSAECCSLIFSISWDFVICICIFASYPLIRCNGQYLEIHPKATAHNLSGQASIIDGDTLEIHGTRIRLWVIDAPESNQLCRGRTSVNAP